MGQAADQLKFMMIFAAVATVHAGVTAVVYMWPDDKPATASTAPADAGRPPVVAPPVSGTSSTARPPVMSPPVTPAAPVTTAAAGPATHKVAPGESYWSIAQKYGTTIGELQRMNGHAPNKVLKTGETLTVPAR